MGGQTIKDILLSCTSIVMRNLHVAAQALVHCITKKYDLDHQLQLQLHAVILIFNLNVAIPLK